MEEERYHWDIPQLAENGESFQVLRFMLISLVMFTFLPKIFPCMLETTNVLCTVLDCVVECRLQGISVFVTSHSCFILMSANLCTKLTVSI